MAQLIVRNLDDAIKRRLQERAKQRGKSMEEEVRDILRASLAETSKPPIRLGTTISARFAGIGIDEPFEEMRGEAARPAIFEE